MDLYTADLTIGEVAQRTGLSETLLRMWEERYGFPEPKRTPSGHRRYTARDCRLIEDVLQLRDGGLSMPVAIEQTLEAASQPRPSLFALVREHRPELTPLTLSKVGMYAVSRAIEDDVMVRAEKPVVVGAFQRERFWRASEERWRDIARTATMAIVLADLPRRSTRGNVREVPLDPSDSLHREWAVVCDAPNAAACLVGSERPGQARVRDLDRRFDAVWTVDPGVVRDVTRAAVTIAARRAPEIVDLVAPRLAARATVTPSSLAAATTLTNRIVSYLERLTRRS